MRSQFREIKRFFPSYIRNTVSDALNQSYPSSFFPLVPNMSIVAFYCQSVITHSYYKSLRRECWKEQWHRHMRSLSLLLAEACIYQCWHFCSIRPSQFSLLLSLKVGELMLRNAGLHHVPRWNLREWEQNWETHTDLGLDNTVKSWS